jgi:hypothetical protein
MDRNELNERYINEFKEDPFKESPMGKIPTTDYLKWLQDNLCYFWGQIENNNKRNLIGKIKEEIEGCINERTRLFDMLMESKNPEVNKVIIQIMNEHQRTILILKKILL